MEAALNELLEPIRKKFQAPELRKLTHSAYPDPSKTSLFNHTCCYEAAAGFCFGSRSCVLSETGGKGAKAGAGEEDELVPSRLDIRVGKVITVEKVSDFNCLDDEDASVKFGRKSCV